MPAAEAQLGSRAMSACLLGMHASPQHLILKSPLHFLFCHGDRSHIAAAEGAFSVVQWLVAEEAVDINPIDRHNKTPLEVGHGPGCLATAAL